ETGRGPAQRPPAPSRHRLARVEQPERVEGVLDAAQEIDADRPEALLQVVQLGHADAVLAGDRSTARQRGLEDPLEGAVDARDLVGVSVVDAARRVQVAV